MILLNRHVTTLASVGKGHGPGAIWPAPPGGLPAALPASARVAEAMADLFGWWLRSLPG
jgi:hypothetical protein